MPRNSAYLAITAALAAFGCSTTPKAVYVDLDQILVEEAIKADAPSIAELKGQPLPGESRAIPGAPGALIPDRASGRIEEAKALIAADRESAIRGLTRRLATIKNREIDRQKQMALDDLAKEQAAYLSSVYDRLFEIFHVYAQKRAPNKFRVEFLKVKKPDLFVSRSNPTKFAEIQKKELDKFKSIVAELDAEYEQQARALLSEAHDRLGTEVASVQAKYETMRANALEQSATEARNLIAKAGTDQDLGLGKNHAVYVPPVSGHQVSIEGGVPLQRTTEPLATQSLISNQERKHSLSQQLEIWLRTRGYNLAATKSQGVDATDEFKAWRQVHQVGR